MWNGAKDIFGSNFAVENPAPIAFRFSSSLTLNPTFDDAGNYFVTYNASTDAPGDCDLGPINYEVINVNRAPVIILDPSGDQSVDEGDSLTIDITTSDPDGDAGQ